MEFLTVRRFCIIAILLAVPIDTANARALSIGAPHVRGLQQARTCPEGCMGPPNCLQDATSGGLRCVACQGSLSVTNQGLCGCTAGRFYSDENTCSTCRKGSYCPGGALTADSQPQQVDCPDGMTTLGMRSSTVLQCVNLPGYSYTPGNSTGSDPVATPCPADTWSRGLRKQRQCVPCPPGFTTGGVTGASAATACFIAAGFYLPAGSGGAIPCPRGTFKSSPGALTNCTACPGGVTSAEEGSTSLDACTILLPTMYAAAMNGTAVTVAKRCPQKFYCPGGTPLGPFNPAAPAALDPAEPTIKACPDGTWTLGLEAASVEECLTPPGFFTANGTTSQCPNGSYRAEWMPADQATSCRSCGEGVFSTPTETVVLIDPVTEAESDVPVLTSPTGCYIKPGQGLYRTDLGGGKRIYRARNCDTNSYGVSKIMYGRTPYPCRECPAGMVTSKDKTTFPNSASYYVDNGDGTGGFVDTLACVTQAGYGYSSRQAQPCDKGYYNDKDNWSTCTMCPYGTTTEGPGAGVTVADCKLAPGFGFDSGAIRVCDIGTYSDTLRNDTTSNCTQCPTGTTTIRQGADSVDDCVACKPGYGGPGCATQCGGVGESASYGPAGRSVGASCTACTVSKTGYSFNWMAGNDRFAPRAVSRPGATSSADCLTEFVQVLDYAWYLPYAGNDTVTTPEVASFADCAALCKDDCQFFTYDYVARTCSVKNFAAAVMTGAPFIAFKSEMSGDVGTSSVKRLPRRTANKTATVQALSSGSYVFYQDATAANIGVQTAAPGAARFTSMQECWTECDYDNSCAAVLVEPTVDLTARPKTCRLVKGDPRPGIFKRSMIRVDINRLQLPSGLMQ